MDRPTNREAPTSPSAAGRGVVTIGGDLVGIWWGSGGDQGRYPPPNFLFENTDLSYLR